MNPTSTSKPGRELIALYSEKKLLIQKRLREFGEVDRSEYFYELAYCLLTPQSSAVHADAVIRILRERDFHGTSFNPEPVLRRKDLYIRFHRTKARHLLELRKRYSSVENQLLNGSTSEELRQWLVDNVKGLGWKEASHFLRNIGHRNLAILDRHILRNLVRHRVLRGLPPTLTPKRYRAIEKRFHKFAREIHIPIDELDLLFWSSETGEILK